MRSVSEYLERAAEFEALAATASIELLKKRYGDIAACYRLPGIGNAFRMNAR